MSKKSGGQPGNNNSGVGKEFRDALRYEIAKIGRELDGDEAAMLKGMRAVAKPLAISAAGGSIPAVNAIADRIDGKAPQSIDLSGEIEIPLSGTVKFVKSSD